MSPVSFPLPALPLPATAEQPETFHKAKVGDAVLLHLNNGYLIRGQLQSLDMEADRLVILDSSGDHETGIQVSELRYLTFTAAHIADIPALKSQLQRFRVEFGDGQSLRGQCLPAISDDTGISLLRVQGKDQLVRLFIPARGVNLFEQHPVGPSAETPISGGQISEQASQAAADLRQQLQASAATDEEVHRALAKELAIPFIHLRHFVISPEAIALVPREMARRYRLIPVSLEQGRLVIAMDDPCDTEAVNAIQFLTNHHLELVTATHADIEQALREHYEEESIDEDILAAEDDGRNPSAIKEHELGELERLSQEKPIIRLVNRMIVDAIRRRASDVHIRPREDGVDLLYRIDGSLIPVRSFSRRLLAAVVSRIKIVGSMDISERRLPQDGRARVVDGDAVVDLRISVIPTVEGESVVIRLLNLSVGLMSVQELGFSQRDADVFMDLLHKSYGIILVTGPTGSGKSTTLYAALQEVKSQNLNIITVEDPVEYHIDRIEQIQVNTAPGYTFARALRHILRHDPDVIMIGEIRDEETGKIAIESALTGHLVLSTLHTNDAAGALTRLMEMGVESYLINATVLGVLAQRLVRRNCPHCTQPETPDPLILKMLEVADDEVFYRGTGCEHCHQTGYSGRIAVYELLRVTPDLHRLIHDGVSVQDIHEQGLKDGMIPLTENALTLARQRVTSLAEVYRVRLE